MEHVLYTHKSIHAYTRTRTHTRAHTHTHTHTQISWQPRSTRFSCYLRADRCLNVGITLGASSFLSLSFIRLLVQKQIPKKFLTEDENGGEETETRGVRRGGDKELEKRRKKEGCRVKKRRMKRSKKVMRGQIYV